MEKVTITGTTLTVSRLCLGTMTFGKQATEAESIRLVETALGAGINFFDTANVYNAGASEMLVGKALGSKRRNVVLASKVRGKMGEKPEDSGLSRAAINKQIHASLERLDTDYLDLYYMHAPDYDVRIEESLEAMDRLVQAGKIRYAASSNYASWQVAQCHAIASQKGFQPIRVTQPMYNLLARGIEQEFLPMCHEFGIATFVYNPLAGGMLTGKQKQGEPLPGTRFDGNQQYMDRYWHDQYFTATEQLRRISAVSGRSMISLALCWLLHHTATTGIILGASSKEQLVNNLAEAAKGELDEATIADLDSLWLWLRGVAPRYNR